MRVSDYIADFLVKQGIDTVFLLSGGGMMHLLDGLACESRLKVVCHHHEQAAGMAAEGYARARGTLGICFATSGPGGTNLVTSIAGAWTDSTPVLYFTGQSKLSQTIQGSGLTHLRQFGTFEVDISSIVKPITKKSYFVRNAKEIPSILEEAVRLALSGRPGPVLIDIPVDIQGAQLDPPPSEANIAGRRDAMEGHASLRDIVERWKSAKRPLVWAGHGVNIANCSAQLRRLLELSETPVVTTMLGKDLVNYSSPYFVGHPGVKGDRTGNWAVQAADFIVFLGSSLHVLNTGYELDRFAPTAYKVLIDPDPAILEREAVGVNVKVLCGVAEALAELTLEWSVTGKSTSERLEWGRKLQKYKEVYSVKNEVHAHEVGRINMYRAIESIGKASPDDSVVVTDAGSAFYVVGQGLRVKERQRVLVSGGLGAMGWAVPAATGASFASSQGTVLCITGDGSLQTNVHELAVIVGNNRNVKILVLNNSGYLSIKTTQDNYFSSRYVGVNQASGVHLPDLRILCEAYGLRYRLADSETRLEEILQEEFTAVGPSLVDILCNVNQVVIPTVSSSKRADGSMESRPIDDMAPFLSQAEKDGIMKDLLC